MAMKTAQDNMIQRQCQFGNFFCLSGFNGRAKLGVHFTGGNRSKGVWVNARSQAQKNFLLQILFLCNPLNGIQFVSTIYYKVANTQLHGKRNIFIRFVVGVEVSIFQRETGLIGSINFTGRNHVSAHALFLNNFINPLERSCFGSKQGLAPTSEGFFNCVQVGTAVFTDAFFIHQINRGSVLLGQFYCVLAGKQQVVVFRYRKVFANHSKLLRVFLRVSILVI